MQPTEQKQIFHNIAAKLEPDHENGLDQLALRTLCSNVSSEMNLSNSTDRGTEIVIAKVACLPWDGLS